MLTASDCWSCGRWFARSRWRGPCRTTWCAWCRPRTRARSGDAIEHQVAAFVRYGSSPRGAQALVLAAKICALRDGRLTPSFADVRKAAVPGVAHRLLLNFEGEADGTTTDAIVERILAALPELP